MNYWIGDEVVCIDAIDVASRGYSTELIAGHHYVVRHIRKASCCGALQVDVGIPLSAAPATICCCGHIYKPSHVYKFAWRFIKLDRLPETEQSEREEKV